MKKYIERFARWAYSLQCEHRMGYIEIDKLGVVYSDCSICGKRLTLEDKTLAELDEMTVRDVAKLMPKGSRIEDLVGMGGELTFITESLVLFCSKCGNSLSVPDDTRQMEVRGRKMELYECSACGEREYKSVPQRL